MERLVTAVLGDQGQTGIFQRVPSGLGPANATRFRLQEGG
jgi:hypothetical protein